eukprot:TRINITY_DN16154_c0_g1_i2.p2 TRINITY_DN16154_c0_g1~~TRINITY_DN16154_c0_g1_i2.p2  ORF type:complete len:212 (-),score=28.49 TRINITY_DN16154_c0_g1_i2:265-858(-)
MYSCTTQGKNFSLDCNKFFQISSNKKLKSGRNKRLIVATSEYWWEDEEEFDAVKDILLPKNIILVSQQKISKPQKLKTNLKNFSFDVGFCSKQARQLADIIWEDRGGPPYFLKMRQKESLNILEEGVEQSQSAAKKFWEEILSQNWQVKMDYGLKDQNSEDQESIIAVVSSGTNDDTSNWQELTLLSTDLQGKKDLS